MAGALQQAQQLGHEKALLAATRRGGRAHGYDELPGSAGVRELALFPETSGHLRVLAEERELRRNGRGEIRTLGGDKPHSGFQDRCNRPLCHPTKIFFRPSTPLVSPRIYAIYERRVQPHHRRIGSVALRLYRIRYRIQLESYAR